MSADTSGDITVARILYSYVFSSSGVVSVIFLLTAAWQTGSIDHSVFLLGCMALGLAVSAVLVAKLENSEWRKELRREAEEQKRKMGVTYEDECRAAANMYLGQPPEPVAKKGEKKDKKADQKSKNKKDEKKKDK
eukprot:TRINITY_DN73993_c0_g1_i1.p2 TRINITY_DN73993_c0_g1~~TRINITY_DN73993_c0_g1_i1.p2  ORF type:complete len:146 (-),score=42.61 TRINITY_DN73993_c0_g1_i1:159-563(-)